MRILGPALLVLGGFQTDPAEAVRKELGNAFVCETVDRGVLVASDADRAHLDSLRASLRRAVGLLRDHAFDPAPSNSILVLAVKDTESFKAYVRERYAQVFELPVFYDAVERRLVVHADIAPEFAPASVMTFLLGEHLGTPLPPPWSAAAILALDEKPEEAESIYDSPAALLKGALRRGAVPSLASLARMPLADFQAPGRAGLHAAVSKKFALYLKSIGLLKRFLAEFRSTFKRDASGMLALETALGKKTDAIEKEFFAHLGTLAWVRQERFQEHTRKAFAGTVHFKTDDDLFLAIATDLDEAAVARAVGELRRLHGPLLEHLDLQPTGLPLTVRLFKDEASFRNFAKVESPDRGWISGYYFPTTRSISANMSTPAVLTHEYCHSLFEDDLGTLPPWAGEGLASLYEEFRLENGRPVGLKKETVSIVRGELEKGRVPALADFVEMKGEPFWRDRERVHFHYDLARAVFLYLQEKGVLRAWVATIKSIRAAHKLAPPTSMCRAALEKALGKKVAAIDEDFRRWVATAR